MQLPQYIFDIAVPMASWHKAGFRRLATVLLISTSLAGCAAVPGEGGLDLVQSRVQADLSKEITKIPNEVVAASVQTRISALLKRTLDADSAVQIALLKNRGLQASLNDLGVAESQMVQASLPPNPRVSLSRMTGPLSLEIERQITGSIFALATLPARREIAQDQFRTAQLRTSEAVLKLAADTRRQYFKAVAANQLVTALIGAKKTAEATAELFKRLGESGGVNKLNQARDFVFYAELGAQLAQAKIQQKIEQERLLRLLGLWGAEVAFKLPSSLPALPRLKSIREVESAALKSRVDIQIARSELDVLAKSLGLTQATRFVSDIDLLGRRKYDRSTKINTSSGELERETGRRKTLEIEIEIPIFDFGQARVAEAEETYMRAANRLAEKAVNARSEAREAYQVWRGTRDVAALYQSQILPLRKIIQAESLLQYNGMLIDVTQLIADSRGRMMSQAAAIAANRDFWIADVDFKHALIGGGVSGGGASPSAAPTEGGAGGH